MDIKCKIIIITADIYFYFSIKEKTKKELQTKVYVHMLAYVAQSIMER